MSQNENLDQKMEDCDQDNEDCADYSYDYPDYSEQLEVDSSLKRECSKDKPFSVYPLSQLTRKIMEENHEKSQFTCLSTGWNLMLFYFCNFDPNKLFDLIDEDNTGRKMIKYMQAYVPVSQVGTCNVCCDDTQLFINACGHSFCSKCWESHLTQNITDRSVYELFPLCQEDGCTHRMNYELMEVLWRDNSYLKASFQRLLCLKYSQKSLRVKLCPLESCQKAIWINYASEGYVECQCGTTICHVCGERHHFPLDCFDIKNWNTIITDKDNQWINGLVVQKCPMCKEPIDKNDGCIHMTCICKHQFCWICMQVWKGHTNFYACSSISKQEHKQRLKKEQQKKRQNQAFYSERFEQAKSQINRLSQSIKRLFSLNQHNIIRDLQALRIFRNDAMVVKEMKEFVIGAWELEKRIQIYHFFQRQHSEFLLKYIELISKPASRIDDLISYHINEKLTEGRKMEQTLLIDKNEIRGDIREQLLSLMKMYTFQMRNALKISRQIESGYILLTPECANFVSSSPTTKISPQIDNEELEQLQFMEYQKEQS